MSVRTVCFCNSNRPWGGGEKWHMDAALALAERGWRTLVLCHPKGELFRRLQGATGISLLPFPLGSLSFLNPCTRFRLTRLFREERVDALITNLPADLKAAAPAAKAAGVDKIIHRRGSALPVRNSVLNRRLYGKTISGLIVNSEATRRLTLVNNPDLIPQERIAVLPNGLDVDAFDAALDAAGERGFLPEGNADPPIAGTCIRQGRHFVFGNAGRLTGQKGQHMLLHLCRKLLDAGLDCTVVIAGTGEREAELKSLAAELGLGERAVFPGFMEDLAPFWRGIDLFVLSSLWEGFGTVLIEAMLAQKPVFAFAVSNIPELVFEDGENGNGRLFPLPEEEMTHCPDAATLRGSPDSRDTARTPAGEPYSSLTPLVNAVLELASNPESGKRMGVAGRRFALRFSQNSCMDALESLLTQSWHQQG